MHVCCLIAVALSSCDRADTVCICAAVSCHLQRLQHLCSLCSLLEQSHNTMESSIPHSSTAGVGKRFAALKKAFQRATGTGFTEMSQKVRTSTCLRYSQVPLLRCLQPDLTLTMSNHCFAQEFEAFFPPALLSEEWHAAVYYAYRQVFAPPALRFAMDQATSCPQTQTLTHEPIDVIDRSCSCRVPIQRCAAIALPDCWRL